ncbi:MAG TPA: MerR family transcriptional regulator [Motilibacteraceae bacterium]|nr:MerR family transcriptional regulator [Motilibacteraceae bacterium]
MASSSVEPSGSSSGPALTVAAVARRLGVAPATLRTWDRRYGLGPSAHTAGAHRRYTADDLARLALMRRLVLEGVAPAEAARTALATPAGTADDSRVASVTTLPGSAEAPSGPRPTLPDPFAGLDFSLDDADDAGDGGGQGGADRGDDGWGTPRRLDATAADLGAEDSTPAGRGGGGRVLPMPDGTPAARGLARAAMALDSTACAQLLRSSLDRRGVVTTWESLVVPVLVGIGERWQSTGQGVEVEHLLSEVLVGALRSVTLRLRQPVNPRPVLLACAEDEQHSLPIHVLAAALAERQIGTSVLGPRVPWEALGAAIRRSGPLAVFVWSQLPVTGTSHQLSGLPSLRPAPLVFVGGPGWDVAALPTGIRATGSLAEAVEQLVGAAGL